jgi:hypothetical protein
MPPRFSLNTDFNIRCECSFRKEERCYYAYSLRVGEKLCLLTCTGVRSLLLFKNPSDPSYTPHDRHHNLGIILATSVFGEHLMRWNNLLPPSLEWKIFHTRMIILGLGFRVNRSSPWIISLVVMAQESKYFPLGLGLGHLSEPMGLSLGSW